MLEQLPGVEGWGWGGALRTRRRPWGSWRGGGGAVGRWAWTQVLEWRPFFGPFLSVLGAASHNLLAQCNMKTQEMFKSRKSLFLIHLDLSTSDDAF